MNTYYNKNTIYNFLGLIFLSMSSISHLSASTTTVATDIGDAGQDFTDFAKIRPLKLNWIQYCTQHEHDQPTTQERIRQEQTILAVEIRKSQLNKQSEQSLRQQTKTQELRQPMDLTADDALQVIAQGVNGASTDSAQVWLELKKQQQELQPLMEQAQALTTRIQHLHTWYGY